MIYLLSLTSFSDVYLSTVRIKDGVGRRFTVFGPIIRVGLWPSNKRLRCVDDGSIICPSRWMSMVSCFFSRMVYYQYRLGYYVILCFRIILSENLYLSVVLWSVKVFLRLYFLSLFFSFSFFFGSPLYPLNSSSFFNNSVIQIIVIIQITVMFMTYVFCSCPIKVFLSTFLFVPKNL